MVRFKQRGWWGAVVLMVVAGCIAGCGITGGIYTPEDQGLTTKKYRYEFEIVPNAMLAKEDTTPDWQLGRYVFVPGDQRLLVISRITSWEDRPKDDKDHPPQIDRIIERVWVTIPADTGVDQELKLEELEPRFLAGYDEEKRVSGKAAFIQPSKIQGVVKIREERANSVLMRIDIVCYMNTGEPMMVKDTIDVPIEPQGIRATPAGEGAISVLGRRHLATAVPPSTTRPASTQPGDAALGDGATRRLSDQSIVGKWAALQSAFTVRVQFDADERYAISLTPSNQTPLPSHVGKYHVSSDTLTLYLDRTPAEGGGPSSVQLTGHGRWEGKDLVIEGSLVPGTPPTSIILRPAEFASMKTRFVANGN